MQAWDSVVVKADVDSPYKGTAGCVVHVDRAQNPARVDVRMDVDSSTQTFGEDQLQRLG